MDITIGEQLVRAGVIALVGMGIVFSFLILLILTVELNARLMKLLGWDKEPEEEKSISSGSSNSAIAAVITAALKMK